MTCETPIRAAPPPAVRLEPGLPPEIDGIASDPSRAFLRSAWFAAAGGAAGATLVATGLGGRPLAALPMVAAGPGGLLRAVPGCYWPFRGIALDPDASDEALTALLAAVPARVWRLGPAMDADPAAGTADPDRAALRLAGADSAGRRPRYALDIEAARADRSWPKPSTPRNLHKHEKKLARLGALDFRFLTGVDWDAAACSTRSPRSSGTPGRGARPAPTPSSSDPKMRRGWETALRDPALAGMLSVGILLKSAASRPRSASGWIAGRTRYCIATSYDARFARHSPGYLTGYRTYVEAAERGVTRLSLGAGDTEEKRSIGAVPEADLSTACSCAAG